MRFTRTTTLPGMHPCATSRKFELRMSPVSTTDALKDSFVDQIEEWLSWSPEEKEAYMNARLKTVEVKDKSHPAHRRLTGFYEPWGLRTEEHAVCYRKVRSAEALIRSRMQQDLQEPQMLQDARICSMTTLLEHLSD